MKYLIIGLLLMVSSRVVGQNIFMPHMMFRGSNDCHRPVYVIPIITSIDSESDSIRISFSLAGIVNDSLKPFQITGIWAEKEIYFKDIRAEDSLVFNIELNKALDSVTFPLKPNRFSEITLKGDLPKAKVIDKHSDFRIYFRTPQSCYLGEWHYDGRYGQKDYRWLFDSEGLYKPALRATYENWSRRDFIEVWLDKRKEITNESFKVIDSSGIEIPVEWVTKRNPTNTIALTLSKDLKPNEKFTLLISDTIVKDKTIHETYFKYPMNVGSKAIVGLAGRYNFLER